MNAAKLEQFLRGQDSLFYVGEVVGVVDPPADGAFHLGLMSLAPFALAGRDA